MAKIEFGINTNIIIVYQPLNTPVEILNCYVIMKVIPEAINS